LKLQYIAPRFTWVLFLTSLALGAGLRFVNLDLKSVRADEFSTIVFSLGNSFRTVPLNQIISSEVLLSLLQPEPQVGARSVVQNLLTESNHPPLYFVLTHYWLKLFPIQEGQTLIWAARSLSACLGILSIPMVFGLSWLAYRSFLVAQLAAALMALSPFGVFLAQEARHYTLAILFVIASLGFLVLAIQALEQCRRLPTWMVLAWVLVNGLGIASHYFFAIALIAELLVLFPVSIRQVLRSPTVMAGKGGWQILLRPHWRSLYGVAAGTLATGLLWVPFWNNIEDSPLTQWLFRSDSIGLAWVDSLLQVLATWITMLVLLPVEGVALPIALLSGLILLIFLLWSWPIFRQGLGVNLQQPPTRSVTQVLLNFSGAAIALFFGFRYLLGIDLLSVPRYSFVYFAAIIVLLGASLAGYWSTFEQSGQGVRRDPPILVSLQGKKAVGLILGMVAMGGLVVNLNLGYYKNQQPKLLAPLIQRLSQSPVLIATAHEVHSEIRSMMGLAWELKHAPLPSELGEPRLPRFLLIHPEPGSQAADQVLAQALTSLSRPLDLWLVNISMPAPRLKAQGCSAALDARAKGRVNGYEYQLYRCSA
jgi:uncharacterized membrane protein